MKQKNHRVLHRFICTGFFLPAVLFGESVVTPIASAATAPLEEIVVTAQRREESLQDVPISITVFSQQALDERNIVNGMDLAKFTPALTTDTRFGADQTTFAIRGFTQELRTAASVAVYFAEVVAPRGGGSVSGGDGAGPGSFFDLSSVQVLKGPQGTLFGRNTTGGAILLVPREPTTELEGYLEGSAGNYAMRRVQGVLNVPITDWAQARFGFDNQDRNGYIKNVSGIGPDRLDNVNYFAGRANLMLQLTDSVQNYTVVPFVDSSNNGSLQGMFACNSGVGLADICQPTIDSLNGDFYKIAQDAQDPVVKFRQWQVINTTTWEIKDNLTLKNILSYADIKQTMRGTNFATNFKLPEQIAALNPALDGAPLSFYTAGIWPGTPTNSQSTFVEELRVEGTGFDDKLAWQAGLYYEESNPHGTTGSWGPTFLSCQSPPGSDPLKSYPDTWSCLDPLTPLAGGLFAGGAQLNLGTIEYLNRAVYSQATYDISEQFRVTAGLRFTKDETRGESHQILYLGVPTGIPEAFGGDGNFTPSGPTTSQCVLGGADPTNCKYRTKQNSDAPTWLIDFDYLPTPNVMTYAKYARGYRQGSVNIFGPEGVQTFDQEQVDSYEIGAKMSFQAVVPGSLNIALFYNDLQDQQLQGNYVPMGAGVGTTGIINAGASTIKGGELDATLMLTNDLVLSVAYAYLDTHLDEAKEPPPSDGLIKYNPPILNAQVGGVLSFSPEDTVTVGLNYRLPLPAAIGEVSVGANYVYLSSQLSTDVQPYGTLDSRELVNLNVNWNAIAGTTFDAAAFVTNATDEEIMTFVPGFWDTLGAEMRKVNEPLMWGVRMKYNFTQ